MGAARTGAASKQLPKTERQKWTALREATRLSQRAEIFEKQGLASKAEQMAEGALVLEEQVRGPWHLNIAQRLDQVADLYTAHKKEDAAEPLYERARAIREPRGRATPETTSAGRESGKRRSEGGPRRRPGRREKAEAISALLIWWTSAPSPYIACAASGPTLACIAYSLVIHLRQRCGTAAPTPRIPRTPE